MPLSLSHLLFACPSSPTADWLLDAPSAGSVVPVAKAEPEVPRPRSTVKFFVVIPRGPEGKRRGERFQ